jgi:flagellar hook-length control protein FliK
MATPETAAIADIAHGARPGKPGKRPDAGATAGAFTAELASLARKPKVSKPEQPAQAAQQNEANSSDKKPVADNKTKGAAKLTSNGTTDAPASKSKPGIELQADAQLIIVAAPSDNQPKPTEALALALVAKTPDGQGASHGKPDSKSPSGVAPIDLSTKTPTSGVDGVPHGTSPDDASSLKQGTVKDSGHKAKFDELIARHQASSDAQAQQNHPTQHVASAAAAAQTNANAQGSQRAEATQASATVDASQAQAGMLLRTPEAASSSNSFAAQLVATTITRAVDQVAWTIARKTEAGDRNFEIRMDPPELGRVDVKMNVSSDGKVSAILAVERPETLDLLTRDSRALEQALKDTGLDVGSGALSFSLRDQNASNDTKNESAAASSDTDHSVEQPNAALPEQVWLGAPKSLLDIKV